MSNKVWNIPNSRAVWPSIRTVIRSEVTNSLMFEFAVIGKYLWTPKRDVSAGQFKWFCYLLQCKTPYITEFLSTSWASVVYPCLTSWTKGMPIVALQTKICFRISHFIANIIYWIYLVICIPTTRRTYVFSILELKYSSQNLMKCTTTCWNNLHTWNSRDPQIWLISDICKSLC